MNFHTVFSLLLFTVTVNSWSQEENWQQKLHENAKIESNDLEKIMAEPSPQDKEVLRLIFANGNQDAKFKGSKILSSLNPTRQHNILSILLNIDEAWVPASTVRNPAFVSSIAETGSLPIVIGGSQQVIDLITFCKVASATLSKLNIEGVDPTMLFGRKVRKKILLELNPVQGSSSAIEFSPVNLPESNGEKNALKPAQEARTTSLASPSSNTANSWWLFAAIVVVTGLLLLPLKK